MKKNIFQKLIVLMLTITLLTGITILAISDINANASTSDKITIHYYCSDYEPYIYYWNSTPNNKEVQWPGKKMSVDSTAKGDIKCYVYEFSGVNKINFLFNNGGEEGENQTEDMTQNSGDWWYYNGQWTDKDPFDEPDPPNPTTGDFRDETIYFLMTTRFYSGDNSNDTFCWSDGVLQNKANNDPGWRGDFKGLIAKLDYIKALGFSAIWITPVVENASDMDYHGYHAHDFSKVDKRYESSDCNYKKLIQACHDKGIKVIQDIVLNHTCNWGEQNFYPLFNKDDSSPEVLETADCMKINDPEGKLPSNYYSLKDPYKEGRLIALKEDYTDTEHVYHHEKSCEWEQYSVQTGAMAGDCVDINTENPTVSKYLRDTYIKYIKMGVDAFRIDTVKHISRLTFNNEFLPYFKEAGGKDFFMFGECCARYRNVWNHDMPCISTPFFTWKEQEASKYPWSTREEREASVFQHWEDHCNVNNEPTSDNAFLNGNEYHTPDRSKSSGLDMIDFPMHWSFNNVNDAFRQGLDEDKYYNDATYNVTYVDSHDYAPDCAPEGQRYAGSQAAWAENLDLMFTFRGIPCIYYGSEVEFKKGKTIDPLYNGARLTYEESGRAYFGDYLEGTVTATDYGEYTNATGTIKETLEYPLAQHIRRLNQIRRKIPALRKGQYSTQGVSGGVAFKRRYTDGDVDSFVCVSISGGATFNGIPAGTYVDAVTGDTIQSSGSLTIPSVGQGNMRVYVLQNSTTKTGKIGEDGPYLK